MKQILIGLGLLCSIYLPAQELYVFTEPASNMPAKSIGVKQSAKWLKNSMSNRTESRHTS